MIDLHSHILPGVDDGARSMAEAVELCRAAADDGCTAIVATPHQRRAEWWNGDRGWLVALASSLRRELHEREIAIEVRLGAEVHVDTQLLAEVEQLPAGSILPLAGTHYLLLELAGHPPAGPGVPPGAGAAIHLIHELVVAGWHPVLAHPEHIRWLAEDMPLVERLVSLGAALQVTAMSLTGGFGRRPQQCVQALLDAGLVHFVASDCHDLQRRPPGLRRAYDLIAARWGEPLARRVLVDNPRAVLDDRRLPGSAPLEARTAQAAPAPSTEPPLPLAAAARSLRLVGRVNTASLAIPPRPANPAPAAGIADAGLEAAAEGAGSTPQGTPGPPRRPILV